MIDLHEVMLDKYEPIVCHNNCAIAQDKVTFGFVFIRYSLHCTGYMKVVITDYVR